MTGAKYIPSNDPESDNHAFNAIMRGDNIPVTVNDIIFEAKESYDLGCRYFHIHARNPVTREQSTDMDWYRQCSLGIQEKCPGAIISYGTSRNGQEVQRAIAEQGEWARSQQAAMSLAEGGAHFSTLISAVDLQMLNSTGELVLSAKATPFSEEVHAAGSGSGYGQTSARTQFDNLKQAIAARNETGLGHEVEWTQGDRSALLTRHAIDHPELQLGQPRGQLNIVVLFGFSPKLPIPKTYEAFRHVVKQAKQLEHDPVTGEKIQDVAITVGAAVLPQHMKKNTLPLDIDPQQAAVVPLERIIAYAAQPDSNVDIVRCGLEDMSCTIGTNEIFIPETNVGLVRFATHIAKKYGAEVNTDTRQIAQMFKFPTHRLSQRQDQTGLTRG